MQVSASLETLQDLRASFALRLKDPSSSSLKHSLFSPIARLIYALDSLDSHLNIPVTCVESALLTLYLGVLCDKSALIERSLAYAETLVTLFDQWLTPFVFHLPSVGFDKALFLSLTMLYAHHYQRITGHILDVPLNHDEHEALEMHHLLSKKIEDKCPKFALSKVVKSQGTSQFVSSQIAQTGQGGMGAIHFKEVRCLCFGVQESALYDESSVSGVSPYSKEGFARTESNAIVRASLEEREKGVDLSWNFLKTGKSAKKTLVFYMTGQKVVFQKKSISKSCLDRLDGEQDVCLIQGESQTVMIKLQKSCPMSVIPLAGENYCWGSDFLIAIQLGDNKGLKVGFELLDNN